MLVPVDGVVCVSQNPATWAKKPMSGHEQKAGFSVVAASTDVLAVLAAVLGEKFWADFLGWHVPASFATTPILYVAPFLSCGIWTFQTDLYLTRVGELETTVAGTLPVATMVELVSDPS